MAVLGQFGRQPIGALFLQFAAGLGFLVGGGQFLAFVLQATELDLQIVVLAVDIRQLVLHFAVLVVQFLVLAGQLILLVAGLVQFVVQTDNFGRFGAAVTLGSVVQGGHFIQFCLEFGVDAFQLFAAFLQVAGRGVRLQTKRSIIHEQRPSAAAVTYLLQIDDQHFDFALQARFLLLQAAALGDQGVDLLLQFRDADVELAPDSIIPKVSNLQIFLTEILAPSAELFEYYVLLSRFLKFKKCQVKDI